MGLSYAYEKTSKSKTTDVQKEPVKKKVIEVLDPRLQLAQMIGNKAMQKLIKKGVLQKKNTPNKTGLPDKIKTGVENISGLSLDDVKVHYNSSKPSKVDALAYTQGNEIHVGSGQEKYLAHEAWHVVQQKGRRVNPTILQNGFKINDDVKLEKEADVMGRRAINSQNYSTINYDKKMDLNKNLIQTKIIQLGGKGSKEKSKGGGGFEKRLSKVKGGYVCYDAVAFVMLDRGVITEKEFNENSGQAWIEKFGLNEGAHWTGGDIQPGTIVSFRRDGENTTFHAGVALGGTTIQAVNGLDLGVAWDTPVDIQAILGNVDGLGRFEYKDDNIKVLLTDM